MIQALNPNTVTARTCWSCFKKEEKGSVLLRCTGCRLALYCNPQCQRNQWKAHKTLCKQVEVLNQAIISQEGIGDEALAKSAGVSDEIIQAGKQDAACWKQINELVKNHFEINRDPDSGAELLQVFMGHMTVVDAFDKFEKRCASLPSQEARIALRRWQELRVELEALFKNMKGTKPEVQAQIFLRIYNYLLIISQKDTQNEVFKSLKVAMPLLDQSPDKLHVIGYATNGIEVERVEQFLEHIWETDCDKENRRKAWLEFKPHYSSIRNALLALSPS